MEENARRGVVIGWGVAIIMLALGFIVGGPYWGWELLAIGILVVMHGHFPKLFAMPRTKVIAGALLLVTTAVILWLSPFGQRGRPTDSGKKETASPVATPLPPQPAPHDEPAPERS
jgi:hypothetical protein